MLQHNIKSLRQQKGMTQKQLADELHVTPQAVSRWENGEVEPSVSAIGEMAKIFDVTYDELMRGKEETLPEEEIAATTEQSAANDNKANYAPNADTQPDQPKKIVYVEAKPVLAVCEICNKPIYDGSEIVRKAHNHECICASCAQQLDRKQKQEMIEYAEKQRLLSYVLGTVISIAALGAGLYFGIKNSVPTLAIVAIVIGGICAFTFTSCVCLRNNFIEDLFWDVAEWGCVKFPGLIFSFDLDGFLWLIGMKILFWLIGLSLGILATIAALALCLPISLFVYPFALHKSYAHPEKTDKF